MSIRERSNVKNPIRQKVFSSVEQLVSEIKEKRKDKKIVFTNGCFDILHPGHIYILEKAASLGELLIVGLNDDSSVNKLKGAPHPVLDQYARAKILSSLRVVDYVILFSEQTPYRIIEKIKPDLLVKGDEYGKDEIVGEDIAHKTVRVKMQPGYSTTNIIQKIRGYGKS